MKPLSALHNGPSVGIDHAVRLIAFELDHELADLNEITWDSEIEMGWNPAIG